MKSRSQIVDNERGVILITVLFLLIIGSIIGTIAINSSTVEVQVSGYSRCASNAFAAAEAGFDVTVPIIESSLSEGKLTPSAFSIEGNDVSFLNMTTMEEELVDGRLRDPDSINMHIPSIAGATVEIDVDYSGSYAAEGGSLEFAQGYEGVGMGAAGGGIIMAFAVTSNTISCGR